MNKDRIKGKVKDIAGRTERQVGEWTGDPKKQVEGAARQVSGKVQNAWGQAKDAAKDTPNDSRTGRKQPQRAQEEDTETDESVNARRSKA
jgi:uncharacterized protein YjbJ (UPF0337 family)